MSSKKSLKLAKEYANKSKAYRKFYNSINTESTISTYAYSMVRFMKFLKSEGYIFDIDEYDSL